MVSELMRFKKERDNIDILFYEKAQYDECIVKTKDFLHLIKDQGGCDYDFWFAYYNIARCYNKHGMKREAKTNMQKAIMFNVSQTDYYNSIWMLAVINNNIGYAKQAVKYYRKCEQYFLLINDRISLLIIQNNIAGITNDFFLIEKVIKEFEKESINYSHRDYYLDVMNTTKNEIINSLNNVFKATC